MTDELKPCPFCGHTPDPENYIDSIHPITRDGHVWEAGCLANEGGCDAFILGDSREDVIKRWNTRAKDVQKAINDEKQNPWKAAIINELIVDCIFAKEHESDPRKALAEAIAWNVKVALDPSASKEARDMQQAAIDAALENIEDALNAEGRYDSADFVRSRKGSNPLAERAAEYARGIEFRVGQLAERDARIAELERELSEQADTIVDGLAKRRELERELAEAREDAKRCRVERIVGRHATAEGAMEEQIINGRVVGFHDGRRCHDTRAHRDATDLELAQAERIEELETLLKDIGDYAHDHSTGPAVPDALWTIREMAYDG